MSDWILTVVIQLVAVRWQVFRTLRRAGERHKDQGGSAVIHKIRVAKASEHHPLAPTAACPLGVIVCAWPSFPGSETYITAYYSLYSAYVWRMNSRSFGVRTRLIGGIARAHSLCKSQFCSPDASSLQEVTKLQVHFSIDQEGRRERKKKRCQGICSVKHLVAGILIVFKYSCANFI